MWRAGDPEGDGIRMDRSIGFTISLVAGLLVLQCVAVTSITRFEQRIRELEEENQRLEEEKDLESKVQILIEELNSKICPNCGVPCV